MRVKKLHAGRPGAGIYILLVLVCFVALFPFYWLINTSLQSPEELFKLPIHYFPTNHLFEAYGEYIRDSSILVWLKNTLIVSGTTCVIATAVGTPAAYALSRFRFRLKTAYTFLILFTQMMSAAFLCIPIYMVFSTLKLTNNLLGLIIIYACTMLPISIWFAKGFFDALPVELEEAARVDGASTLNIFFRILLPLLRPGIVATGAWIFIAAWDEYLYAYTMISDQTLWTNSVGLASYIGQYSTPWDQIMTGAVLVTLPVVFLFMYFQRHIVSGLTAGSVKG